MRNLLIILGLVIALGIAGFIGTAEVARRRQNAEAAKLEKPLTGDPMKDSAETNRQVSQASGDLAKRQGYAMIGGGVGAAVGLLVGIVIVMRLDRRRQTR